MKGPHESNRCSRPMGLGRWGDRVRGRKTTAGVDLAEDGGRGHSIGRTISRSLAITAIYSTSSSGSGMQSSPTPLRGRSLTRWGFARRGHVEHT